MKTAAIIPAYNEAERIGGVLGPLTQSRVAEEIIVVVDGATDDTARVAAGFEGVRVIALAQNLGKGGALSVGVANTQAEALLFLDADLEGLLPGHVGDLTRPILADEADMTMGILAEGAFWSDAAQKMSPEYTGQRALRRWLFERITNPWQMRFGIEIGLNHAAKVSQARVCRVALPGVAHCHKEVKLGLVRGAAARAKMYAEMGKTYVRVHQSQKNHARPHQ